LSPHIRRWQDLRSRTLIKGLCIATIPPAIASWLANWLFIYGGAAVTLLHALMYTAYYFALALTWSLISGLTGLWIVARWRGLVGRTTCLLLGCIGAYSFPIFASIVSVLIKSFFRDLSITLTLGDLKFLVLGSLAAIPFGLFGGWMFWRIGVRPAIAPQTDLAPIFD